MRRRRRAYFNLALPFLLPFLIIDTSLAGKARLQVSLGLVPRDADTPKRLWGKLILMRGDHDSLIIKQIFVWEDGKQVALTKYPWAPARRASMQALIDDTKKWPKIVGDKGSGLSFNCADPECAADDGVENMNPCQCRSCEAERILDEDAGVWLHKSCAANEWAAGDGGSGFVGEVDAATFVCKQCRDASRDAPAAGAGAGRSK